MFQLQTKADTVDLSGLRQGLKYTITVTALLSAVKLQYRHLSDTTWYDLPGFTGTAVAGAVVQEFVCNCTDMRLVLVTPGAHASAFYHVSAVPHMISEY